jgi:hypothetical protein
MKTPAVLVMAVGRLNHDVDTRDAAKVALQICGFFLNAGFSRRRWRHVTEGDLNGCQGHVCVFN